MQEIDLQASKLNIFSDGRTISGWSRLHNLKESSVKQFFYGKYVSKSEDGVYGMILSALKKDGYIVYK